MTYSSPQPESCEIITEACRLAEVAAILAVQSEIAVDLEADSLHHYREKVCLLQISTRTETWLIDPLAVCDLKPLSYSFSNPGIRKVMHGADYDIRSLHRDFGLELVNLFDTMIASRFLGIAEFGLAALLRVRFGLELDKKYQKADWSKRPLTPEMNAYAAADTSHLLLLYDQLCQELATKNRLGWQEEECELLCRARANEKEGPLFLSFKGAGKLKPRELAILEELLQLRDCQSRELDRPPFKVMPSESLIGIAEKQPRTLADLSAIRGMTPGQIRRYGDLLLHALETAFALPEQELPRYPRERKDAGSDGTKACLRRLKEWRTQRSLGLGIETGVLAPNWLLENIVHAHPDELTQLGDIPGMREWQKRLYGEELLDLLKED